MYLYETYIKNVYLTSTITLFCSFGYPRILVNLLIILSTLDFIKSNKKWQIIIMHTMDYHRAVVSMAGHPSALGTPANNPTSSTSSASGHHQHLHHHNSIMATSTSPSDVSTTPSQLPNSSTTISDCFYASDYWNIPYSNGLTPMKQIEGNLCELKFSP